MCYYSWNVTEPRCQMVLTFYWDSLYTSFYKSQIYTALEDYLTINYQYVQIRLNDYLFQPTVVHQPWHVYSYSDRSLHTRAELAGNPKLSFDGAISNSFQNLPWWHLSIFQRIIAAVLHPLLSWNMCNDQFKQKKDAIIHWIHILSKRNPTPYFTSRNTFSQLITTSQ